jgi:hypothetical protein
MKQSVHHGLGIDRAKQVAEHAFESYKQKLAKYNPQTRWATERKAEIVFSVKGVTLTGSLEVGESDIALELDVPFLFRPFKGTALRIIEEEVREWVGKAKAGEI